MKPAVPINLASEPFERRRPIIVAAVALAIALLGLLGLQSYLIRAERDAVAGTRAAVDRASLEVRNLAAERSRLEAVMLRPENTEVLDQSVLLNSLLTRKGISWTAMFSDLEKVLPHNVRLISVRPQVDVINQVQLEMVVGAQAPEPVIDMLKRLENSPMFGSGSTTVTSFLPPSQSEPLFRYRVNVSYAQKL